MEKIVRISFLLALIFLLLPNFCQSQSKPTYKGKKISHVSTGPYIETITLKTTYVYENSISIGYIKYEKRLSTIKKVERTSYWGSKDVGGYETVYDYNKRSTDHDTWYESSSRQEYKSKYVPEEYHYDKVLSSKTDTIYVKNCGCNIDFIAGKFKISDLYPDWSIMSEEQIEDWIIKNCNQEAVDKLNNYFIEKDNSFIEKEIRENFYPKGKKNNEKKDTIDEYENAVNRKKEREKREQKEREIEWYEAERSY